MNVFFTFFIGVITGIASHILIEKWVGKKGSSGLRPSIKYLLIGTFSIIFFILAYRPFDRELPKKMDNSPGSTTSSRVNSGKGEAPQKERFKIVSPGKILPLSSPHTTEIDSKPKVPSPSSPFLGEPKSFAPPLKEEPKLATTPSEPVLIKDIIFRKARDGGEAVLIYSNGFFEPDIFPLEGGDRPRVVVDIKNTLSIQKGLSNINAGGEMIKRIRSHLDRDTNILRVVLDLAPKKNYYTDQLFYKKDNVYSLEVKEEAP